MKSGVFLLLAALCGAFGPAAFAQEQSAPQIERIPHDASQMIWDLVDTRETLSLTLRRPDGAGDKPFFAACAEVGKIDMRIGAPLSHVKAAGQAITLTLRSGKTNAQIAGRSEFFQPTGSHELFAAIKDDHPLLGVLGAGAEVRVEKPGGEVENWPRIDP
ncbi:MAG: hypothetical protein FJX29_14270, partial [Alphaproteobacteria bacterium]|nr:hypothetical protein [Alphaproteobacteria bacterium]